MSHEVETMFSWRETPWHGLGNVLHGAPPTAAQAIVAGGLDWTVSLREIFRKVIRQGEFGQTFTTFEVIKDRFELTRDSDGTPLAILSDKYRPFQNRDAFAFMDSLVASGAAVYETAGSLKGGRVVFVTMKLPNYITLPGGDKIETYLLLRTTHDGTGRIMVYVVNIRVVCMNTLTWAIEGARHKWGVTHTSDVQAKVAQAQQALGFTIDYEEAFRQEAAAMMDIRVTDDQIVAFLKKEIDDRPKKLELIDKMIFNVRNSPTVGDYAGTAWGAFNGVTELLEHGLEHRSAQAQFIRTFEGDHFKIRSSLRSHLLSLA